MSLSYKKFTKDIGLVTIVHFLTVLKGIIFLSFITKMLGALNYGIWVQLLVTTSLIAPLIRLGLTNSLIRYLASEKDLEEIKEGIYFTLFSIITLSIIVFFLFLLFIVPISEFFQSPTVLVGILPLIILFECLNGAILTVFQALQKMARYSFFMVSASVGEITLVISAIYLGYGLKGAVFSLFLIRIIIFAFLFVNMHTIIGFKIPKFNLLKKYLSFGLPTLLSNIAYLVVTSIDKYLVGFFMGTLFVGYYAPAYSLGNLITFFIIPISFVLFPSVSKSYDENKMYEVKNKLKYSLKYFLTIAIPAVFGMSVLMKEILRITTNQEIASNAFFVTPFIASSILFYGASDIFSEILALVKKTKKAGLIWAFAAILNIALNLLLIPYFGILGAAIATLASYISAFSLIWYYSFKEFTFEIDWPAIIKILICSLLMSILVWKINPSGLFMTLVVVVIGAVFYTILTMLTKVFAKKELDFLRDLLKKQGA